VVASTASSASADTSPVAKEVRTRSSQVAWSQSSAPDPTNTIDRRSSSWSSS
jgi:hypothetical protein